MKKDNAKELLLEQLKKMPVVELACQKANIGRTTYYRWRKNPKFAKEADAAITEGEALITDLTESQLISLIRDRNFQALQLWLRHHHPKYNNKIEINGRLTYSDEELTPEQMALVKAALRLASFDKKHEKEK